jgi:hypothetical protein
MVMRWWRHLKMLKRGGRGHDPDGVSATKPGSLAVECPACPQNDRNLPPNWRTAPKATACVCLHHLREYVLIFVFLADGYTPSTSLWTLISD